jgi:multidrug efflux pump subunit AcrA (membrane-fusion protein)
VDEGQQVKAGQLIAIIESDDLQAARKAAEATANSQPVTGTVSVRAAREGEVVSVARRLSPSSI